MKCSEKYWKHLLPPRNQVRKTLSSSLFGCRSLRAVVLLLVLFVSSLLMVVLPLWTSYSATKSGFLASLTPAMTAQVSTLCPDLQTSVRIIDSSPGRQYLQFSNPTINDPSFVRYVKDVSENIFAKVREMPQCTGDKKPKVELFFVYRSLISHSPLQIDAMRMYEPRAEEVKYLDSPWSKIAIGYSPELVVCGVFFWNVQQLFFDQALLSGIKVLPNQLLAPISVKAFEEYITDYFNSVENIPPSIEMRTERLAAEKRFSERTPAEVFWFLKLTRTRRDLSYFHDVLCEKILPNYVALNKKLFEQLSTSISPLIRYKNILDLKDLIDLEQSRVKSVH
jgi:hypothetical protein